MSYVTLHVSSTASPVLDANAAVQFLISPSSFRRSRGSRRGAARHTTSQAYYCRPRSHARSAGSGREREAQNQVAAATAAVAAARRDGHEFFAVHHVHGGRRKDPGARVEFPQEVAGLRVVGEEVARDVAAGADEHDAAGGHDRASLTPAVEHPLPHELARRLIESPEIPTRPAAPA